MHEGKTKVRQSTLNPQLSLLALIGLFVVANLATPSLTWETGDETLVMLELVLTGGLMSEVVLLAIWAVFGTDEFPQRLGQVIVVFALGWCSWVGGIGIARRHSIPWYSGLFVALGAILFMALLIGAALVYRSRTGAVLCYRDELRCRPGRVFQFSIAQILGWTTSVALFLTVSRFLFHTEAPDSTTWREIPSLIGRGMFFVVLILIVTSACFELALGRRSIVKSFGALVLAVPMASMLATIMVVFVFGTARRAHPLTETFGAIFVFFLGLSLTTTFALTWVRWCGFRLVRFADTSPEVTNEEST